MARLEPREPRSAQSASPRPQRVRAVDAVKLAKKELAGHTGPIVKAGRLRLAAVESGTGPVLHEGFYKLAAAVQRPAPSLRQKALALQRHLEEQLQGPPAPQAALGAVVGAVEHTDTFLTQEEPSLDATKLQLAALPPAEEPKVADSARRELELCVSVLQSYARETSAESRERSSLLELTAQVADRSIETMALELERRQTETLRVERNVEELKVQIAQLEDDCDGLRRVVQQMLKDEGELRKEKEETDLEVKEKQESLQKSEMHSDSLAMKLREAQDQLHRQKALRQEAQERLRDGANSPMMHFSSFVLGPDQVPSFSAVERVERSRSEKREQSRHSVVSTSGLHQAPQISDESSPAPASQGEEQINSESEDAESLQGKDSLPWMKSGSCRRSASEDSSDSEEAPARPSVMATAFPALVPFLDFQRDGESDRIKAQTAFQNQEHLEKHMVLLQEERQKHLEQNKRLQAAVDSTMERILVWVQATYDSLRDFGPASVHQDVAALASIRDMLTWLGERSCEAWLEPGANLQQVLQKHEDRLRQALEQAEHQQSKVAPEVEELRRALQEQTERAEELEEQLRKAEVPPSRSLRPLSSETLPMGPTVDVEGGETSIPSESPIHEAEAPEEDPADAPPVKDAVQEECEPGRAAALEAEEEAQRMRIFRCPFAEAIDLTLVRRDRQFPYEDPEDKRLGRRPLRHLISEVYTAKGLEDRRRDRASLERRPLHVVMQELLRRQHGVRRLVHQRSWQLLEAIAEYASEDVSVCLFADFLDGSRDSDELSFYLYCSHLIASMPEEAPATRLPLGFVSHARASRLVETLFSDLPKARAVVKEEIEKQAPQLSVDSLEEFSQETPAIEADALCQAFLEGWRLCCLLLGKSMPHFSWRDTVMAFILADVHRRGWLDPNEVQKAEQRPLAASRREAMPLSERTTLGAFVFRVVHHLGGLTDSSLREDVVAEMDWGMPWKQENEAHEALLSMCVAGFRSLERSLGVYLKWLLHSVEPRDRAVYKSVKCRIYAVRQAGRLGKPWPMIHNFRCLLTLLLSHQFDLQLVREEAQPEHLAWELTALLQILRESWRRGATGEHQDGPDFGPELEEVGEPELQPERHGVSFTLGKNIALE